MSVVSTETADVRLQLARDEEAVSESLYSSDGSDVATETLLDERKSRMIESIVRYAINMIKFMFLQARGNSGSTSSPQGQDQPPGQQDSRPHTTYPTAANDRHLKRKMDDRGRHGSDEEDEDVGDHEPKPPPSSSSRDKDEVPRYACPYFKHNPSFYKGARGCPGPGWVDVHRVK
jgi:hypothetical protein